MKSVECILIHQLAMVTSVLMITIYTAGKPIRLDFGYHHNFLTNCCIITRSQIQGGYDITRQLYIEHYNDTLFLCYDIFYSIVFSY